MTLGFFKEEKNNTDLSDVTGRVSDGIYGLLGNLKKMDKHLSAVDPDERTPEQHEKYEKLQAAELVVADCLQKTCRAHDNFEAPDQSFKERYTVTARTAGNDDLDAEKAAQLVANSTEVFRNDNGPSGPGMW